MTMREEREERGLVQQIVAAEPDSAAVNEQARRLLALIIQDRLLFGQIHLCLPVPHDSSRSAPRPPLTYRLWPVFWRKARHMDDCAAIIGSCTRLPHSPSDGSTPPAGAKPLHEDDTSCNDRSAANDDPSSSSTASSSPSHSGSVLFRFGGGGTETCSLCMDHPSDICLAPCAHRSFCSVCVMELLCRWHKSTAPSCPICRSAISLLILIRDEGDASAPSPPPPEQQQQQKLLQQPPGPEAACYTGARETEQQARYLARASCNGYSESASASGPAATPSYSCSTPTHLGPSTNHLHPLGLGDSQDRAHSDQSTPVRPVRKSEPDLSFASPTLSTYDSLPAHQLWGGSCGTQPLPSRIHRSTPGQAGHRDNLNPPCMRTGCQWGDDDSDTLKDVPDENQVASAGDSDFDVVEALLGPVSPFGTPTAAATGPAAALTWGCTAAPVPPPALDPGSCTRRLLGAAYAAAAAAGGDGTSPHPGLIPAPSPGLVLGLESMAASIPGLQLSRCADCQ